MDTITHIVLGACIAEAIAGKQLGKKVLLIGALAQNIPDIDFVASSWLPTASDLLAHRGFTHSFLFLALVAPPLAWLSRRLFPNGLSYRKWLFFWAVQIFIHDFIDAFNVYGTGWFEPFSHYRVCFNSMFVADPLFSIWPAIALLMLAVLKGRNRARKTLALTALSLSCAYLLLGLVFKSTINETVANNLADQHTAYKRYFTTPTPLNNLLWYVVAENDAGYFIGYRSIFDNSEKIKFHYVARNSGLLAPYQTRKDVDDLIRFSQGYYTTDLRHDTLTFNDLRFGEIAGWPEPGPSFVFHYYVQYPDDNKMIVQRGRFAKWDRSVFKAFVKTILNN